MRKEKEVEKCPRCGLEMFKQREMNLHIAECEGSKKPEERFATGDKVVLGALGQKWIHRNTSVYEVISLRTDSDHTVRVRDIITGTKTTFAQSFLVRIEAWNEV